MKIQMTREQKQMVRRLRAKGCSYRQIERDLGVSMGSVAVTLSGKQVRPGKIDEWSPAPGRLSAEEREDILVGLSPRRVDVVDRSPARPGSLDCHPRGRGQRRNRQLWGLAGALSSSTGRSTAEESEAGPPSAHCPGHGMARGVVESSGDLGATASQVP